jgi:malonyl-CoA/methylmalonyl-CoA synthetase
VSSPSSLLARWRLHATTARPAVIDASATHTYRVVDERAHRVASALLQGRASLSGERIGLLIAAEAAFVEAFFGVLLAGGVVVVLSPLHPAPETTYFCDDAEVTTLVVSPELVGRVNEIAHGRRLLLTDELRNAPLDAIAPEAIGTDPALQLYTSGTTGKPKGAVISHDNLAVQQALLEEGWGFAPSDVLLHALPLHHLHGLGIALLTALGAGACARMLPQFDAIAVWEAMASSTVLMAVPTMYTKLFLAFDAADPSTQARWSQGATRLRLATSGSAALPVTLGERWKKITGSYPLERFGMTEIGVGMINPLHGERRPGTVGKPLPSVDIRIIGEDGSDSTTGELWVRGPSVFTRYHRREEATAQAFVAASDSGGSWFRTGDTVTHDEAGYVRILGRTSVDILKSGGYKLSALEIEEVLREHPAVAEVAVLGLPDETWGDRVVACVIARHGREPDCSEELLRAFAKTRLASYKVPKSVVLMRELPRNAVGKVIKPELAKRLRGEIP